MCELHKKNKTPIQETQQNKENKSIKGINRLNKKGKIREETDPRHWILLSLASWLQFWWWVSWDLRERGEKRGRRKRRESLRKRWRQAKTRIKRGNWGQFNWCSVIYYYLDTWLMSLGWSFWNCTNNFFIPQISFYFKIICVIRSFLSRRSLFFLKSVNMSFCHVIPLYKLLEYGNNSTIVN